jgi:hypothetical protein
MYQNCSRLWGLFLSIFVPVRLRNHPQSRKSEIESRKIYCRYGKQSYGNDLPENGPFRRNSGFSWGI